MFGVTRISHQMWDSDLLQGALQGVNLSRHILLWAETLVWPCMDQDWGADDQSKIASSWGVSWVDLFFNFVITTGIFCPVKVCGELENVQYVDYMSDEARILPSKIKLFLEHVSKGGKALHRYGYTGQVTGLRVRPSMLPGGDNYGCVQLY